MAAESTAKTTNLEKIIYFLSLMSFSINRLKSCILFSCKKFVFWFYVEKKFMLQEMMKCWRPLPLPPFSTALHLLHNYPTFATKRQNSEQSPDIDGWNFRWRVSNSDIKGNLWLHPINDEMTTFFILPWLFVIK